MSTRRRFLRTSGTALAGALAWSTGCGDTAGSGVEPAYDVLVYGATPAGIAAAVAAADDGCSVALVEPTARIGGLIAGGLSHTDFRTFEGLNGAFNEFRERIVAYYSDAYGADSQQVEDTFRGTQGEPEVNLQVFQEMLADRSKVTVFTDHVLTNIDASAKGASRRIEQVDFLAPQGANFLAARVYLDATYEGDLLAEAGVEYRVGREGRDEYGESLAPPDPDGELQAYNFRLIATQEEGNRVAPKQPNGYRRNDYLDILPLLADGTIKSVFGYPRDCVYKAQIPRLPNAKYDINDVSHAPVRMSLPGENLGWPDGDHAERARIFDEHLRWNVGLLWFLQNDEEVPERFRAEASQWGWCADEFPDTAHLPPQLYVREARRMVGQHVYTEQDTRDAENDARTILHPDSIAMGDYGHNCHGTNHEGPRIGGKHTGEFYKVIAPYQIPYGVLVPKDVENLLVPTAASSSHVGFCALRLEPIWMSLGQAAGHAAALAVEHKASVQDVSAKEIQERLWSEGGAVIYVSDVPPGDPDFAAVQWWGSLGGLHGLAGPPEQKRGANILGQYHEAYVGHAAELDRELDEALWERWLLLAGEAGVTGRTLPGIAKKPTRGDWIRAAWQARGAAAAG